MPLYRISVEDRSVCVANTCIHLADASSARECATHVAQRLQRESCKPLGGWSVSVTDDDGDEVVTLSLGGSAAFH
jgi:hypothetical protein